LATAWLQVLQMGEMAVPVLICPAEHWSTQ
jgi:hypothetical protein